MHTDLTLLHNPRRRYAQEKSVYEKRAILLCWHLTANAEVRNIFT